MRTLEGRWWDRALLVAMLALSLGLAAVSRAPWASAHPPSDAAGLHYPSITVLAGRPAYLVTGVALLLVVVILAGAVVRQPVEYTSSLVLAVFALGLSIGVAVERVKVADAILNPQLQLSGPAYTAQGGLNVGALASIVASALLVALAIVGLVLERRFQDGNAGP